jgi:hypothetical protein
MKTIAVAVAVFALCLLLASTASADSVSVTPTELDVSIAFDKPKDTTPSFTTSTSFTIKNNVNKTVVYSVSDITSESGITISPSPPSGTIGPYGSASVSLTITLSSSLSEGGHTGKVKVEGDGESHTILIRISVTHKAKLEVSPTSLTFDIIGASGSTSKTVTFSETLGYKPIEVSLTRISGNDWVTASSNSFTVNKGGSQTITFRFEPSGVTRDNCVRYHSWTYSVSSTEGAGSYTINLNGEICCPAKLSYDYRSSTTISFNRPKTEQYTYHATAKIKVSNEGCEQMYLNYPRLTSPSGGVSLSIKNYPSYLNGYSSGYIEIDISTPYDTPEGSYTGSVSIDAGAAGSGSAEVQVFIKHEAKLTVTPTVVDFQDVEILKEESRIITLKEELGYKSVRNILINKRSGPEWISAQPTSIYGIPAGGLDNVIFTLKFRGDAIPGKEYDWIYEVTSDAGDTTISLSGRAMPIDNSRVLNDLAGMRNTNLYKKYPQKTEAILSNCEKMKATAKGTTLTSEDWGHVELVLIQSLTFLKSLDVATEYLDNNDHDNAFQKIVIASTSSKSIESNSKGIPDLTVKSYAWEASTASGWLASNFLNGEVSYYTERAQAMSSSNFLEAVKACRNVATAYGLMQDSSNEREFAQQAELLLKKHDELVENANENRVEAEKMIQEMRENELTRIGGDVALFNPFNYDTVSKGYFMAIDRYTASVTMYNQAGEIRMSGDANKHLEELNGEWRFILIGFYAFMVIMVAVFAFILFRSVKGMIAYMQDSNEERLGDVVSQ